MKCPKCKDRTRILETRETSTTIRRRRECLSPLCGQRFTTTESNVKVVPKYADEATLRARAIAQDLKSPRVDHAALEAAIAVDIRRAEISRRLRAERRQDRDTWYDTGFDPAPSVLDSESLKRELGE